MAAGRTSRHELVAMLSTAVFMQMVVAVMMGPLLLPLAESFNASVAAMGQLAAAIGITWGIAAPLVGPVSDIYGRRKMALVGVILITAGTLASLLAWDYQALLACRLFIGIGAAMIPPNSMATIADHFAPDVRGRPMSILAAAWNSSYVVGLPAIAALGALGGWRLPFAVVGGALVVVLAWHWRAFPASAPVAGTIGFAARFKTVTRISALWPMLAANVLFRTASFALFTYFAALLIATHGLRQGETALPLALAGTGAMLGSLLGGRVASRPARLTAAATGLLVGGLAIGAAFTLAPSGWVAAGLAGLGAMLMTVFEPVSWVMLAEVAGESRATANGLLATSNQLGIIGGGSLGGVILAVGGFASVGVYCTACAVAAALIVIGMALRSRAMTAVDAEAAMSGARRD